MSIKDNIKNRRSELGLTLEEVAKLVGVSRQTIQKYENGIINNIPSDKIELLSYALRTTPAHIMGWTQEPKLQGIKIPVLGYVRAGVPISAVEEVLDEEEISADMARDGDYFALRIKGDSMEPKISEGDVVIVRQQEDADSGAIVIVVVNGDEATCKKLLKFNNGIRLVPSNPAYEPIYYSAEEIESLPVKIVGKVVELRAKFS